MAHPPPTTDDATSHSSCEVSRAESRTLRVATVADASAIESPDRLEPRTFVELGVTREDPTRYQRSTEIGRGGIGRVVLAFDSHMGRSVAVKELLFDDCPVPAPVLLRFLREARVTALLEHPNIVPVYELGQRDDGTPYYTMRVVHGRTLAEAIRDGATLAERLILVNHYSGLCQAIAYAHSRRIAHRDIKPENVMIGEFGETIVLDWGMAKACATDSETVRPIETPMDAASPSSQQSRFDGIGGSMTVDGTVFGTPSYMSPEQARGEIASVNERSDVWSLGVVLFTILAGRPPFAGSTARELIAQVQSAPIPPLGTLDPTIPPELAAIAARALERDPARRYPTARELARDVQAYQAGAPVTVYDYSSIELLRRFVARNRAAAIVSAIAATIVVALAVASHVRLVASRDRAEAAEKIAHANELFARHSERIAKHSLADALVEKAQSAARADNLLGAAALATRALAIDEQPDARGIVVAASNVTHPRLVSENPAFGPCARLAYASLARRTLCAQPDALTLMGPSGRVRLDAAPSRHWLSIAVDGRANVVAALDARGAIQTWFVEGDAVRSGAELHEPHASTLAISDDGNALGIGTTDGSLRLYPTRGGHADVFHIRQPVTSIALSADGRRVAVGGALGTIQVVRRHEREATRLDGHAGTVASLAFSPDGNYLASGGADRALRIWDLRTGEPARDPYIHDAAVSTIAWSPDGRYLAYADRNVHVVELHGRSEPIQWPAFDAPTTLLAFADQLLVSVSAAHDTKLWRLEPASVPTRLVERGNVLALAFVPGRPELVSAGLGPNGVCIWDLSTGDCQTRLPSGLERVRAMAVSHLGRALAIGGTGSKVYVWDLVNRIPLFVLDNPVGEVRSLAFSPDDEKLALAGSGHGIFLFDATSGRRLETLETQDGQNALEFSDLETLVAGGRDGVLTTLRSNGDRQRGHWPAHIGWVMAERVFGRGRRAVSAGADGGLRVWDLSSRRCLASTPPRDGRVLSVDVSADGRFAAASGEDGMIQVFEAARFTERALLAGHVGPVRSVAFSPDSRFLASAGDDGTIRLWITSAIDEPMNAPR